MMLDNDPYDLGDGVDLRHEVRDADGELIDATVALVVTRPDGTTFTPAISNPATGIYVAATFTADQTRYWPYTWTVSGPVTDVVPGGFFVSDEQCVGWPVIWCADLPTAAAPVTGTALRMATEILWALSGRRYSTCEVTLRPCRQSCNYRYPPVTDWPSGGNWWPWGTPLPGFAVTGWWGFDAGCGTCATGRCGCGDLSEVVLPAPVAGMITVKVDGTTLPYTSYRVDNNRLLVRTDGETWPTCQDLALADTEEGTWSVRAAFGEPVPVAGQLAVGELACEIARDLAGLDCRLPSSVQQITRQGVSINFVDPTELVNNGRLGLRYTDMWLASVNPHQLMAPPMVFDVDNPGWRRTG